MASAPKSAIPTFGDIGVHAEGILDTADKGPKVFLAGEKSLKVTTKTNAGLKVTSEGKQTAEGKMKASIKGVSTNKELNTTFTEKWDNKGVVSVEAKFNDHLYEGLSIKTTGKYTDKFEGTVEFDLTHELLALNIKAESAKSLITPQVSIGHGGWVGGFESSISLDGSLGATDVKVGFQGDNVAITGFAANDFESFGLNYAQTVNSDLQLAVQGELKAAAEGAKKNDIPDFQIGAIYKLNGESSVQAKINSNLEVSAALKQKLNDDITITLSTSLANNTLGGVGLAVNVNL